MSKNGNVLRMSDIIAGLKAGWEYERVFTFDTAAATVRGTERLAPIGDGPPFVSALHVCETTQGDHDELHQGAEEIDGIAQIIGGAKRWRRLS